jgi:hypothetical protein
MERCNIVAEATDTILGVGLLVPLHIRRDGDELLCTLSHLQRLQLVRASNKVHATAWHSASLVLLEDLAAFYASARSACWLLNQTLAARAAAGDAAGVAAAVTSLRHFQVPLLLYATQTDADAIFTPAARRFVVLQTAQLMSAAAKNGDAAAVESWSDWLWSLGAYGWERVEQHTPLSDAQTRFYSLSDDLAAALLPLGKHGSVVTASVDKARLALLHNAISAEDGALAAQLLTHAVEKQASGDALRPLFAAAMASHNAAAAVAAVTAASQARELATPYRAVVLHAALDAVVHASAWQPAAALCGAMRDAGCEPPAGACNRVALELVLQSQRGWRAAAACLGAQEPAPAVAAAVATHVNDDDWPDACAWLSGHYNSVASCTAVVDAYVKQQQPELLQRAATLLFAARDARRGSSFTAPLSAHSVP